MIALGRASVKPFGTTHIIYGNNDILMRQLPCTIYTVPLLDFHNMHFLLQTQRQRPSMQLEWIRSLQNTATG